MKTGETFFMFPISLLAHGETLDGQSHDDFIENRLRSILNWCVVDLGIKERDRLLKEEGVEAAIGNFPQENWPAGAKEGDRDAITVITGMRILHITGGSVSHYLKNWRECGLTISEFERHFGRSPLVRLKSEFWWSAIKRNGLDFRQISTLCAIYSCIGTKETPQRITRDTIRARALGFNQAANIFDLKGQMHGTGKTFLAQRGMLDRPMTINEVRWTIQQLESRDFFARYPANRRETYFSHRMTKPEMVDWFRNKSSVRKIMAAKRAEEEQLRTGKGAK